MKSWFTIIICILIALLIIGITMGIQFNKLNFIPGAARAVKITDLSGDVNAITYNGTKTIKGFNGMRLVQGDTLITGERAFVLMELDGDKEIRISENTSLVIDTLSRANMDTATVLSLTSGKMWTSIKKKLNIRSKYEIKTPTAVMGVKGTKFYAGELKDRTETAVLEGTVSFTTKEEATVLVNAKKQLSLDKNTVLGQEDLGSKITELRLESLDLFVLEAIMADPSGIDPEIINQINEIIKTKQAVQSLIDENLILLSGKVTLPDMKSKATEGHIHVRDNNGKWVYYSYITSNGEFVVGGLPDGSYWLRADPSDVSTYARSNETSFIIKEGHSNISDIALHFNTIQFKGAITDPLGSPVTQGSIYICTNSGKSIYYTELEKGDNHYNTGGLPNGDYRILVRPLVSSEYTQSFEKSFSIKNGVSSQSSIDMALNNPQIRGTITSSDGSSKAIGAHVHIGDGKNNWIQYVESDLNGGFKAGGLLDGKYILRADSSEIAGNISSKDTPVSIVNGQAVPSTLTLVLK